MEESVKLDCLIAFNAAAFDSNVVPYMLCSHLALQIPEAKPKVHRVVQVFPTR